MNATIVDVTLHGKQMFWLFRSWKAAYKYMLKLTDTDSKFRFCEFHRREPITQQQFIVIPT